MKLRGEAGDEAPSGIRDVGGSTGLREGEGDWNTGSKLLDKLRKCSNSPRAIVS